MFRMMLAAVCCLGLASASQCGDCQQEKFYQLVQADSGKVLGIAEDSEESGARAVVSPADPKNLAQQWKLEKDGDYFKLINRKSGKVLDVFENSMDEDAPIILWDEKSEENDNQRWSWVGEGAERRIKSKLSNLVFDRDGDGKVLQKKASENAKGQLWKLKEIK